MVPVEEAKNRMHPHRQVRLSEQINPISDGFQSFKSRAFLMVSSGYHRDSLEKFQNVVPFDVLRDKLSGSSPLRGRKIFGRAPRSCEDQLNFL